MTTSLIKHIASGQAFFTGAGLMILVVLVSMKTTKRRRWAIPFFFVGLLLVALSSTPLPFPSYWILGAIAVIWLIPTRSRGKREVVENADPNSDEEATSHATHSSSRRRVIDISFVVAWLIAVAMEVPYHIEPTIPPATAARLTILADSVTAGMGENEAVTWPRLFEEDHAIDVADHSQMGATVASAAKLAAEHPPQPGIVFLEIGGNDILGSTTPAEFEGGLRELLKLVCASDRQVVMLELPLPPFYNAYGEIQRSLAAEHEVTLIPKRFLLDVLLSDSTTLDSIHLSQEGHRRMADRVWVLLRTSLEPTEWSRTGITTQTQAE